MTPPGIIPWNASDAAAINEFLNTPLGQKWLAYLFNRKPKIEILQGTETAGITGAYAAGYEHFFTEIAATRATPSSENYSAKTIDPTKD